MPSSRWRIEEEQREAVGARLGMDGAKSWQSRAWPQLGADDTSAPQGHPFQLPLAAPMVPWPSGNSMAGPGSPARPAVIKWERDEDIFFPLVIKEKVFQLKEKHQ